MLFSTQGSNIAILELCIVRGFWFFSLFYGRCIPHRKFSEEQSIHRMNCLLLDLNRISVYSTFLYSRVL